MPDTAIPRPGFTPTGDSEADMRAFEQYLTHQRTLDPSFQAPDGFEWKGDHYERDTHGLVQDIFKYLPYVGFATAGGIGAAGALGAGGGAGAAASGGIPEIASTAGVPAGLESVGAVGGASAVGGGGAAAAGGGMTASNWLDAAKLGADFLGGAMSPKPQKRQSYDRYHDITSPHDSLYALMNAAMRMGSGLDEKVRKGVTLRSTAPRPVSPISIPGLGFQIGGGMGTDPALDDPSLLHLDGPETYQPFNGYGESAFANAAKSQGSSPSPVRRRNPNGAQ